MTLKNMALVLVLGLIGIGAQAAQKKKALVDEVSGQGYGMAGCGLGSIVFGDKPGMIQVIAATLNGTGMQTFGISSGTSNCEGMMKSAKADQFIEVNKMALEKEMVRGQGENMSSLGSMMGCHNSDFSAEMTSMYKRSFPQGNASAADLNKIAIASCEL